MLNEQIILPDKRVLSYALYGPGDGKPVLYFHGTPSSRLEPTLIEAFNLTLDSLLLEHKLQLIAVDRPGMGYSSFNRQGNFASFADDAMHLLNALNVEQCDLLCWSGGGPFALAMAHGHPNIVRGVYIIAGFTQSFGSDEVFKPMHANKLYFRAAKKFPSLLQFTYSLVPKHHPRPLPRFISGLPKVDHKLVDTGAKFRHVISCTLQEAIRTGSKGAVYEAALYFSDFGFELEDIQQPVHYWWGMDDNAVIRLHADAVDRQVKHKVVHYVGGEGHFSIYINYFAEVLKTISLSYS